jgi:hypothetical protein
MSCCLCQTVPRGSADAISMDYERSNCIIVHSKAQHIIETCSCCGHRIEPLGNMMCLNTELISGALAADHLEVIAQFDAIGHMVHKG